MIFLYYDALEGIEDEVSSSNEKYNVWSTSFIYNTLYTKTIQLPFVPEMFVMTEDNGYVKAAMAKLPGIVADEGHWVKFTFNGTKSKLTLMCTYDDYDIDTNITIYIWYK